jgi:hypothetical protein
MGGGEIPHDKQLEKAGVVTHAQQSGAGKLVKVAVGGKLNRRWGEDPLSM